MNFKCEKNRQKNPLIKHLVVAAIVVLVSACGTESDFELNEVDGFSQEDMRSAKTKNAKKKKFKPKKTLPKQHLCEDSNISVVCFKELSTTECCVLAENHLSENDTPITGCVHCSSSCECCYDSSDCHNNDKVYQWQVP